MCPDPGRAPRADAAKRTFYRRYEYIEIKRKGARNLVPAAAGVGLSG